MDIRSGFDEFDPKDGHIPAIPISLLPDIARRARLLLYRRSREEIAAAAEMIDYALTSYFDNAERKFIDDQLENNRWACKYLDEEARTPAALRELIARGLPDTAGENEYFDFPTADNTTEIEALKLWIDDDDRDDPITHEDFRNPQHHELFAVLALSFLAECLHWSASDYAQPGGVGDITNQGKVSQPIIRQTSLNLSLMARMALMAMDAVGYAEHLSLMPRAEEERQGLIRDARQERRRADELEEVLERRTAAARKGAVKRHWEHAAMREQAIRYYEDNEASYKSVEAAARDIVKNVVPVAHRTVVDWIHSHRRQRSSTRP